MYGSCGMGESEVKVIIGHDYSDLFGKKGMAFWHSLSLLDNCKVALDGYLSVLDTVRWEIQIVSSRVQLLAEEVPDVMLLLTVPGVGYYTHRAKEIGLKNGHPVLYVEVYPLRIVEPK